MPDGERIAALEELLFVVVGLDQQQGGAFDGFFHLLGEVSEIGGVDEDGAAALEPEADGIHRVVRSPERSGGDRSDAAALARDERKPLRNLGPVPRDQAIPGAFGAGDRNPVAHRKGGGAPAVVAVFVGDEHRGDVGRRASGRRDPFLQFAAGKPRFHQQGGGPSGDQRRIAGATGTEDTQADFHDENRVGRGVVATVDGKARA